MRPPERSLIGPSRFVILLRALLVAQALGRCRRTEVRAAIASAGSGWSARTARSEAAATATGPGSTEATATAEAATPPKPPGRGPPKPPPGRGAKPPEPGGRGGRSSRARASLTASGRPWNGCASNLRMTSSAFVTVDELDERKSARTTGLAIDRHGDVGGLCDGREVGAEIGLSSHCRGGSR